MSASVLRQFVQVLLMGEALSLRSVLAEGAVVDDPILGALDSTDMSRLGALWRDRGAGRDPKWVAFTDTPERAVAEFEVLAQGPGGAVPLPVAVVAEPEDDQRLRSVRLYHGFWPLEGAHRLRGPIVPCEHDRLAELDVADPVRRYQDALYAGDLEAVLAVFAEDAYAREPAGGEWTYRGSERLREFYGALFSNPGGIPLRHCTITDDGTCCAIEYIVDRWGSTPMPVQSGVAVYQRSDDRLAAARIYDDVDPPL